MKPFVIAKKAASLFAVIVLFTASATLLTSCVSTPSVANAEPVFRFMVIRYPEPVEVAMWRIDSAQSANPEGAALNIATFMEEGDVDRWVASWDVSERPILTREERISLMQKWQYLRDGRISMVGRVVAGTDLVMELSVVDPQQKSHKIQLPLKHVDGQWWLTSIEPNSEYLQWENSTNKILSPADPLAFKAYLNSVKLASAK